MPNGGDLRSLARKRRLPLEILEFSEGAFDFPALIRVIEGAPSVREGIEAGVPFEPAESANVEETEADTFPY
jgi:hypothetical protein